MLSFSGRVEVPKNVLVRFLGKECVLLNLKSENYYGLDEIGTRIWQLLTTAASIEDAYTELFAEFDVDASLLRQNLSELVERLVDKGLLQVRSGGRRTDPGEVVGSVQAT